MFTYHVVMLVMFVAGSSLTIAVEATVAGLLLVTGVVLSLRHRQQVQWRWPGVRLADILSAFATLVAGVVLLTASMPMFPPRQPSALPWYLAGGGIVAFNVLQFLRLVTYSEVDFRTVTSVTEPELMVPVEQSPVTERPWWHKPVRWSCLALCAAAWLSCLGHTYVFGQALRHGSPVPTALQTALLQDDGVTVYINPTKKALIDILAVGQWGTLPVIALSVFCHFVLGIKILTNVPTLAETRDRL
jgi:hypothetical protein